LKKIILLAQCIGLSILVWGQQGYWQQQVDYKIDVSLNDKLNTLDAFAAISYTNHSPDTLTYIWFHCWPNAYKNDRTAFSDHLLGNGNTKFYFSGPEQKGYINRLEFKVNNTLAETEDHPEHIDIVKLILPSPLAPGATIQITTPFHVKLPFNFSRGGYDGESYQVTQWYPKPAVYDRKGWHPMPYLDQGEFYSEFGNYEVSITVPANYVVAATGVLQNPEEKEWLQTRKNFSWDPVIKKEKNKYGQVKKTQQLYPSSTATTKTLTFIQQKVHDFAWFADKRFVVMQDTCQLASGKTIDIYSYYTPASAKDWSKGISYAKAATRFYSAALGEYPYQTVSVVEGPASFGGGMEYPTITVISAGIEGEDLDETIAHEIGHNWFYGILASNERDHPWMDEGMNSYYEQQYMKGRYEKDDLTSRVLVLQTQSKAATNADQPIETPAADFNKPNYTGIVYNKTVAWMHHLEQTTGSAAFAKAMQTYYQRWQFRHPQPEDFKQVVEEVTGRQDTVFALLHKTGVLPGQQRKGIAFTTPLNGGSAKQLLQGNNKMVITALPAFGINSYDKFMIGATVTNLSLPPNKLQFLFTPLYATGSKQLKGIGFVNYSFFPQSVFQKIQIGLNGSFFTADEYNDPEGKKVLLGFQKLVPNIRFVLKEKNLRSTMYRYIQFKSFLIQEDRLSFYRDTVISGNDTTFSNRYRMGNENRVLNQLKIVMENNRKLYPYRGELNLEQGDGFVRAAFTGNYFFNYSKGGGLDLRFFAGKFFYTGGKSPSKQLQSDRYHLNMTGANGYEDYTYSDYFIGRNKFEGWTTQQIMVRDGGFKVRTDLLANKIGKTDDWLVAANFSSTFLPPAIPIRLFADIGTYAEAWDRSEATTDRFLFDAGFQVSLLKQAINIYIPVVYSGVYKDYVRSIVSPKKGVTRILKTISFSIDLSALRLRKLDPHISL